jgi:hypothetical protein
MCKKFSDCHKCDIAWFNPDVIHVHTSTITHRILNQTIPAHTPKSISFNIDSSSIPKSGPTSSERSLPYNLSHQNFGRVSVYVFFLCTQYALFLSPQYLPHPLSSPAIKLRSAFTSIESNNIYNPHPKTFSDLE